MAKEHYIIQIIQFYMREILQIIISKEMENTFGMMEIIILVNG